MISDISKGATSTVYVMPHAAVGRPTIEAGNNWHRRLVERNIDQIPTHMAEAHRQYVSRDLAHQRRLRAWAAKFITMYEGGSGMVPNRRGNLVSVDNRNDWTTAMVALAAVHDSGLKGVTCHEIQQSSGVISGGIGGSLSDLHESGVIAGLEQRR